VYESQSKYVICCFKGTGYFHKVGEFLVIILPRVFGLGIMGIWISYPIADVLAVILTVFYLRHELKKMNLWFDSSGVREELADSI